MMKTPGGTLLTIGAPAKRRLRAAALGMGVLFLSDAGAASPAPGDLLAASSVAAVQAESPPSHVVPVPAARESVRALVSAGRCATAESLAVRSVAREDAAPRPDSARIAAALELFVQTMLVCGRRGDPRVREAAERAVAIKQRVFGEDHPQVAVSLIELGETLGHTERGRQVLERALAIQERALGSDHNELCLTLEALAYVFDQNREYGRAIPLVRRSLEIARKSLGPDNLKVAVTESNLAWSLWRVGDLVEATRLFDHAMEIFQKTFAPDHPNIVRARNRFAVISKDAGDYVRARRLFEQVLADTGKAWFPDDVGPNNALAGLGLTLLEMGDYVEARGYLERALTLEERVYGSASAQACLNLGQWHMLTGDHAHARSLYERALELDEKQLGAQHPYVAQDLGSVAAAYRGAGDDSSARRFNERALAIFENSSDASAMDLATVLEELARNYHDAGDHGRARVFLGRALALRDSVLGPGHPSLAASWRELAAVFVGMGARSEAMACALRADSVGREHLRLTCRGLPERQALRYAAARSSALALALRLAAEDREAEMIERAWDALVQSRALVLDEMASRQRQIISAGDTALARLAGVLAETRKRLASLAVGGPRESSVEEYRTRLEEARRAKEQAEIAVAERNEAFRRDLERGRVRLADVRAVLPRGCALVAYARCELESPRAAGTAPRDRTPEKPDSGARAGYLAFVMRHGEVHATAVMLGDARMVDSLVSIWAGEVRRPVPAGKHLAEVAEQRYRRAGEVLRQTVWDPLERHLGEVGRVFVVPDGALHMLSFAALPTEKGYMVESGPTLHYLSAERDLATAGEELETRAGLLVFGAPAFDDTSFAAAPPLPVATAESHSYRGARSACGDFGALRFAALPGTLVEAREVASLWNRSKRRSRATSGRDGAPVPARLLIGAEASESSLKRQAPESGVLHVATHGFFLGACPSALESGRAVGGLAADLGRLPPLAGENPLLLSGLALAGANDREAAGPARDDGILTAEEVASLDLSGVRWAVLSACETGVGEIRAGEGVLGLRRAFQVAGARTLIMSLWSIEDEATREWMRALYQGRLERRLGAADAVRYASLITLKNRRDRHLATHPFYWGAFVGAGGWR